MSIALTTLTKRLSASPELLRLPCGSVLDYRHPAATAFCVVGQGVVALALRGVHLSIFNAVRAAADPATATDLERARLTKGGSEAIYEDFGILFRPTLPSENDLSWFRTNASRELGQMRHLTFAGRAWRGVSIGDAACTVVSWWVKRHEVSADTLALVLGALKPHGACLVEYDDSDAPECIPPC